MIQEYSELFSSTCGAHSTFRFIVISVSSPHHSGAMADRAFRSNLSSVLKFRMTFEATFTQRKPDGDF